MKIQFPPSIVTADTRNINMSTQFPCSIERNTYVVTTCCYKIFEAGTRFEPSLTVKLDKLHPRARKIVTFTLNYFDSQLINCKGLRSWVNGAQKDCPFCKTVIYQHQAGVDFVDLWPLFIKYLDHYTPEENDSCSLCCQDFPLLPYKVENGNLIPCKEGSLPMTAVAATVRAAHHAKKIGFPPATPPSFSDRVQRDRPLLLPSLIIGAISILAMLLHRKYPGKFLYTLGFPAELATKTVRFVGRGFVKLLSEEASA